MKWLKYFFILFLSYFVQDAHFSTHGKQISWNQMQMETRAKIMIHYQIYDEYVPNSEDSRAFQNSYISNIKNYNLSEVDLCLKHRKMLQCTTKAGSLDKECLEENLEKPLTKFDVKYFVKFRNSILKLFKGYDECYGKNDEFLKCIQKQDLGFYFESIRSLPEDIEIIDILFRIYHNKPMRNIIDMELKCYQYMHVDMSQMVVEKKIDNFNFSDSSQSNKDKLFTLILDRLKMPKFLYRSVLRRYINRLPTLQNKIEDVKSLLENLKDCRAKYEESSDELRLYKCIKNIKTVENFDYPLKVVRFEIEEMDINQMNVLIDLLTLNLYNFSLTISNKDDINYEFAKTFLDEYKSKIPNISETEVKNLDDSELDTTVDIEMSVTDHDIKDLIKSKIDLFDVDLSKLDVSKLDLSKLDLSKLDFSNINLSNALMKTKTNIDWTQELEESQSNYIGVVILILVCVLVVIGGIVLWKEKSNNHNDAQQI